MFINDEITILLVIIVVSYVALCVRGQYLKRLERDIHSERLKLMHERTELERKYHMYM